MQQFDKDNYFETVLNDYNIGKDNYLKNLSDINNFQKNLEFKEFFNMIIRCTNANARAIKYFRDNHINYYDTSISNDERSLMIVTESYLFAKYTEALTEFYEYIKEINILSDKITESFSFKLFKFLNSHNLPSNYNFKEPYLESQEHVKKYYEIGDEIYNYSIENNIYDAIYVYLPIFYNNISERHYIEDPNTNHALIIHFFHLQVIRIVDTLKKLNLTDRIHEIAPLEQKILMDGLREKTLIKK